MPASLDTFAKVRALHDSTTFPAEKAVAAERMEALARAAGMTTAEALSKLDREASRPTSGIDWTAFAEAFWKAEAAADAKADAPQAPSRRRGLPIYDPNKVEPWRDVAEHCLQLDWIIPKAHGGKFLTKDERARLKVIARQYCLLTNATADWIETVLARCEAARQSWRDRGKGGAHPDRKATESDIEKAAQIIAAAKRREASKLDTLQPEPEPEPEPRTEAQGAAAAFNEFFSSPEMRAAAAKREAERQVRAAAVIAEYGSEEAVFADTPREAALRAACAHLTVWDPRPEWSSSYHLAGWDSLGSRSTMPAAVREAVSRGWPLPGSVAEAWTEREAAERLEQDRHTCTDGEYIPHSWVEARRYVLEDLLDTLPARSLTDLRARLSWMECLNEAGISHPYEDDRTRLVTLRADIERMGTRIRESGTDGVPVSPRSGKNPGPPDPASSPVQTGHRPTTRAERRAAAAALIAEGLSDRETARRLGISPTTVGLVRRDIGKARP